MILRAKDECKSHIISSDDDQLSLAVCVEHLPDLESRFDGFFYVQERSKLSKPGGIVLLTCSTEALMFEGPPK